jgi:hypothetical protein
LDATIGTITNPLANGFVDREVRIVAELLDRGSVLTFESFQAKFSSVRHAGVCTVCALSRSILRVAHESQHAVGILGCRQTGVVAVFRCRAFFRVACESFLAVCNRGGQKGICTPYLYRSSDRIALCPSLDASVAIIQITIWVFYAAGHEARVFLGAWIS